MRKRQRTLFVVSFLAPAVILYGVFVAWPVLQAFVLSCFRWRGVSENKRWVGVDNFKTLFADEVFWKSLVHNLGLLVGCGIAILILAMLIAHAMQGKGPGIKFVRSIYLFPQVISLAVVAILWEFIFNPVFGMVTNGLKSMGLGGWVKTWLGDPNTALACVGVAFVWWAVGFYIMLLSAGIRAIPEEVIEASELDGAQGLTRFRQVTLPLLWSVMRVSVVYLVINAFNVFVLVFLMTAGGPDRHSEVMLTYLYEQAFRNNNFGLGTTIGVANFVVVMLVTGIVLTIYRKDPTGASTA